MNLASLCVTCPNRESGFCGTLLGTASADSKSERRYDWQHFVAARAGAQIAVRNQVSNDVFVICAGWAYRYFQLSDGRRQILQFLLPGDLFSPATIFENAFHFSVKALTEVRVSGFARSEIREKFAANPGVQSAIASFFIAETRDAAELLTALGQLSAEERIAHLLLHLMQRIAARNVIREQRYPFPLRQQHIADAVGLTPVHVSRVFSLFRDRYILALSEGVLKVFDLPELERIGSLK
jgi:CRP/FNR family transcriptional regulator